MMSGISRGSRPCLRTQPQLRLDCSPAMPPFSQSTTETPRSREEQRGAGADDAAADHDDIGARRQGFVRAHGIDTRAHLHLLAREWCAIKAQPGAACQISWRGRANAQRCGAKTASGDFAMRSTDRDGFGFLSRRGLLALGAAAGTAGMMPRAMAQTAPSSGPPSAPKGQLVIGISQEPTVFNPLMLAHRGRRGRLH